MISAAPYDLMSEPMSDPDPLLQKADVLMQRYRPFAAGDDVPLLTEVIDAEIPMAPPLVIETEPAADDQARIDALVRQRFNEMLPKLRRQVADELDAWFDEQLPTIVQTMLDGVTDRIVSQITSRARGDLMTWLQTVGEDLDRPG
jgi:hypothetical protein